MKGDSGSHPTQRKMLNLSIVPVPRVRYLTKGIPNKQVESFDGQAEDILADSAFAFY
jgi:hypothetical protein